MVDILANGDWGRDDGIRCACGGTTYLVDDQGHGLCAYACDICEKSFQVQYENDDDEETEDDFWDYPEETPYG